MTISKGRRRSGCLLLAICAAACFGHPRLSFLTARPGPAILRGVRHSLPPLAAGTGEWTPEEEKSVMDTVLGRAPSSQTSPLAAEIRLVRQQTQELIQEIRLLRQSIKAPAPQAAPPAAPARPAAPVQPPPAAAPPSSFATASPPVAAPPADGTGVRIVSAGFEDGNAADFYLNNRKVDIRGQADRRGVNVMTIDPVTQQVTSRKAYDVWGDPANENTRLVADLNSLPDGRIVLVAMKDSGMENFDNSVLNALRSLGSSLSPAQLKVREGYALIGTKGGSAIAEMQSGRAEIEADIPCLVRHPPPLPPEPAMPGQTQFGAPTWAQQAPAPGSFQAAAAPAPSSFPTAAAPAPSSFPTAAAPAPSSFPTAAAPSPPSSFPTAATSSFPTQQPSTVSVPKLQVDPQGGVSYNDETVEREGSEEESGQSWQEVVSMLDKLQEKIKAKRLAGV